jgi:hypothetical protein
MKSKCRCNRTKSLKCIDKLCGRCCNNIECKRHNNSLENKESIAESKSECFSDSENIICFACNENVIDYIICDGCNKTLCDDCSEYDYELIRCSYACSYCRSGLCMNQMTANKYCKNCYVKNPDFICKSCDIYNEMSWKCDKCGDIYCHDCNNPNVNKTNHCFRENCKYCIRGDCYNISIDGAYCNDCFVESNHIDSDYDEDNIDSDEDSIDHTGLKNDINTKLKNKQYIDIFDNNITIELKESNKNTKSSICSICMENKSNCCTQCNHEYCIECFSNNYCIYDKKQCSMCRQLVTSLIIFNF